MPQPQPLQIFRAGTHTAMSGATLAFTEADLAATCAAYDPARHEAPLVVGHPQTDAPAYGWVSSLACRAGTLDAVPHQVNPEFAQLVSQGAYKKISAAFYAPDAPANPVPGVYYLKHVGFLGAAAPAVKGLRAAHFAAADAGVVEFSDWSEQVNASLWRRLRDWMIAQFGLEAADQVISTWDVSSLETEASKATADAMPAYREPTRSTDPTGEDPMSDADRARLAALEAENERLKTEAATIAAANAATLQATRHATHAAFAEQLCVAGTLLPAHKPTVIAIMDRVAEGAAIAFGEGDQKTEKPALVAFQEFLQALPKQVDFSERAGGKAQTDIDTEDSADLAKRAIEFVEAEAKAGRQVSIATAVTQLAAQAAAAS